MTHDNVTDIVERLLDVCVDWDGAQMNDAEEPRTWLAVGELRMAADTIATLRKQLENAREALIQADLTIRSFKGTDQSDVEFIREALAALGPLPAPPTIE